MNLKTLNKDNLFYAVVTFLAVILSLWLYFFAPSKGTYYTTYNDYMIFKQSFSHLLHHADLYARYTNEYNDLFKYSPTFALLMAPFAYLPNLMGLILWNVLNFLVLFYAIKKFPFPNHKSALFASAFILIEALTSLIFTQSNCIVAGLLIIALECLEKKKLLWATFVVSLSVFIKPFGLAAFLLFLFYPKKIKAFLYSLLWFIVLFICPLLLMSWSDLVNEYSSWAMLLKNDHDSSLGLSIMGLLHSWFNADIKLSVQILGIVVLLLPLLRFKAFKAPLFRSFFLASILIWAILFNHKAEPPGYIIAVCGVAIWYFMQAPNKLNTFLLLSVFVLTVLEPTDVFPKPFRDKYLTPHFICVLPCILVWIKVNYDLLTKNFLLINLILPK